MEKINLAALLCAQLNFVSLLPIYAAEMSFTNAKSALGHTPHQAGTGFEKNFELKTRMLFYFEEHTSVILKNVKIEKSNGGFLRNLIKSQRKWLFFK